MWIRIYGHGGIVKGHIVRLKYLLNAHSNTVNREDRLRFDTRQHHAQRRELNPDNVGTE